MRKIVGIGETVLDVIFRNDQPTAAVPGGLTFNALISLGRTIPRVLPDLLVLMVTEVGDDHIGDIVVSFMKRNNVRVDAVTRHLDSQTHVSMAFLDERNDAQYEFYKDHANARLCPDKVTALSFVKDDIVLFGSYFAVNPVIRDYTRQLLTAAREAGDNFNAGFVYALATQDVRREGRVSLSADALESALDIATKFSSAACRTTFNYVDEDFSL